jgi:anti-anti-sigma factor
VAILSPQSDYCDVVLELTDPGSRSARIRRSGEFDISNCWRIRDVFARAVDLGYTALQVDMSEVSFIGSASLRELLLARRLASDANIQATVISASPVAFRVMTLMGVDLFNGGPTQPQPPSLQRS